MHSVRRRAVRCAHCLLLGLACLALALAADYILYPRCATIGGTSADRGENGLWLRYTWYLGHPSDEQLRSLAQSLPPLHIRFAYFHVRSIAPSGQLEFRDARGTRHLTDAIHRFAPGVRALAWVYAGNERGQGKVSLADPEVQQAMVGEARWLVTDCGFDGVQWDYEVCPDGDESLLALLRETRAVLPPGKLLGVAAPVWVPRAFRRWGWSDGYFAQVAAASDQIAVMCYDTGMYLPRAYVWLIRQQAMRVTGAVQAGNPQCRVLLGLPTYRQGQPSHHAYAENLRLALKGVREGLALAHGESSAFAGVAIFADYTTEPTDWATYGELWVR